MSPAVIGFLLTIVAAPLLVLLRAFVLTRLWLWFIVPLGVMPIGMAHAYGLCLVLCGLTGLRPKEKDAEPDPVQAAANWIVASLVTFLLTWFLGWVTFCCM